MATMMLASPSRRLFQDPQYVPVSSLLSNVKPDGRLLQISYCPGTIFTSTRSLICCGSWRTGNRPLLKPISAVGSGLEATITDPEDSVISIKNIEIVVESKDDNKMQVRVDLLGKETGIVFEKVLRNLARTAPPLPGFRRDKGGKTSKKVPRDFLLQILGEDRVTSFVIQEIVSTTLGDYVKKENLTVKDNKINTIQTAEELKSAFIPGNGFGFNATLELENSTEESELEKSTEESDLEESTEESS